RHLLANVLSGVFHLAVEHEAAGDARAAVHHHDLQFVQTADAAQLLFDGQDHLAGHFVRAGPRQPDADADDRRISLWKEVHSEVQEREDAQYDKTTSHHRLKSRPPNTAFRQCHCIFLLSSSALSGICDRSPAPRALSMAARPFFGKSRDARTSFWGRRMTRRTL